MQSRCGWVHGILGHPALRGKEKEKVKATSLGSGVGDVREGKPKTYGSRELT